MPDQPMDPARLQNSPEVSEFLSKSLGVHPYFFAHLGKDDDWAFIIKTHALLEGALNHLLTRHFGDPRLADVFSKLENNDTRRGKLAFVGALELLPKEYQSFIKMLGEIRNKVAHDVKNLGFDLRTHVGNFDKQQLKKWKELMLFGASETAEVDNGPAGKAYVSNELILEANPRQFIAGATAQIVSLILDADIKQAGGTPAPHYFVMGVVSGHDLTIRKK